MIRRDQALEQQGLTWLDEPGCEREIVMSTRVRLARNLQGSPFADRAGPEERLRILDMTAEALDSATALGDADLWAMKDLEPVDRGTLFERHQVSRELVAGADGEPPVGAAYALGTDNQVGLMINEEDHLRLQALRAGLQLQPAWRAVERLDEELGGMIPFAFHHEFGFLTSCPTNVGTGLRASVLIHLPGLVLTKEIQRVLQGIAQVGLTYRGLFGEGSDIVGNLFQMSNQTTLGKSEEELIDHLTRIVSQVIQYEKQARGVLLSEAPAVLEDKVWRAYGLLSHARSLSMEEMLNLLSGVRLGLTLKLLKLPRVETLNRAMIFAQKSHLERDVGRGLDEAEADVYRATHVRQMLEAENKRPVDGSGDRARTDCEPGTDPESRNG